MLFYFLVLWWCYCIKKLRFHGMFFLDLQGLAGITHTTVHRPNGIVSSAYPTDSRKVTTHCLIKAKLDQTQLLTGPINQVKIHCVAGIIF